jgi:hypothetical protein
MQRVLSSQPNFVGARRTAVRKPIIVAQAVSAPPKAPASTAATLRKLGDSDLLVSGERIAGLFYLDIHECIV